MWEKNGGEMTLWHMLWKMQEMGVSPDITVLFTGMNKILE